MDEEIIHGGLEIGDSLTKVYRQSIIDSLIEENPQISKTELLKKFFLRMYGNDFEPISLEKILQNIEKTGPGLPDLRA